MLEEALLSAINQNSVNFDYEIIVVDNEPYKNGGTETSNLMEKYKDIPNFIYYRNEENLGMFGNWNRCIELARGEWVTLLHDDDLLIPNYLKMFIKYFFNITSWGKLLCAGLATFIGVIMINTFFLLTKQERKHYLNILIKKIKKNT